ncbi:MAG: hypothetical protein II306_06580 [Clostridia bacterium]|nr:hypothetical protein [Clostridia bacterium]
MTDSINVNELTSVSSIGSTAQFPVLTDVENNIVNLIDKTNLADSLISPVSNNLLTSDANGLVVNNIVGLLSNLNTATKTSVVSAINELVGDVNNLISPEINTLATSGIIALSDNSHNKITPSGTIQFQLPTITDLTKFHQIFVQLKLTNTSYLSNDNLGTSYFFSRKKPVFTTGAWNIIYEYDLIDDHWVVGAINKGSV